MGSLRRASDEDGTTRQDYNSVDNLDRAIREIEEWVLRAGNYLMGFWRQTEAGLGGFLRDTSELRSGSPPPADGEPPAKEHPTTDARAFVALLEFLRFIDESLLPETLSADAVPAVRTRILGILQSLIQGYERVGDSSLTVTELKAQSDLPEESIYLNSRLLISMTLGRTCGPEGLSPARIQDSKLIPLANQIAKELRTHHGAKARPSDEVHDFVTLLAVKALDLASLVTVGLDTVSSVKGRVTGDLYRNMAAKQSGMSSFFDPSELAFNLAVLSRFSEPEEVQLIATGLRTVVDSQADDGSWPIARLLTYGPEGSLHFTSYDVALAICDLCVRRARSNDWTFVESALVSLLRCFALVQSSVVQRDPIARGLGLVGKPSPALILSGWCNDHSRQPFLTESWVTATVLEFLIHLHDLAEQVRQHVILEQYSVLAPANDPFHIQWPELTGLLRAQIAPVNSSVEGLFDPTDGRALSIRLSEIASSVGASWVRRPDRGEQSLLMYGPPGTGKTAAAKWLASALGWPYLELTPADFLRDGMERVEAHASQVFDDLRRLRRVVILFDECEDFFKSRRRTSAPEFRTIGAFLTAGMLPKLQKLSDSRWSIYLLAVNCDLVEIDSAARRPGRFDRPLEVPGATPEYQVAYVISTFRTLSKFEQVLLRALRRFNEEEVKEKKYEPLGPGGLRRLGNALAGEESPSEEWILSRIKEIVPVVRTTEAGATESPR